MESFDVDDAPLRTPTNTTSTHGADFSGATSCTLTTSSGIDDAIRTRRMAERSATGPLAKIQPMLALVKQIRATQLDMLMRSYDDDDDDAMQGVEEGEHAGA